MIHSQQRAVIAFSKMTKTASLVTSWLHTHSRNDGGEVWRVRHDLGQGVGQPADRETDEQFGLGFAQAQQSPPSLDRWPGVSRPSPLWVATTANVANADANIRILRRRISADSIGSRNRACTHSTHSEAGSSCRSNAGDDDRCRPG